MSELTTENLKVATFAGMASTPNMIRRCQSYLNSCQIENFYGMTEGVFFCTGATSGPAKNHPRRQCGYRPARMQICWSHAGAGKQYPRSLEASGELHYSGDSMISTYLNVNAEDIYEADGRAWFRTGDKVFAGEDGQVFFHGRYKDLIIRGGANISPAKIKSVLPEMPELRALHPQIMAALTL